MESEPSTSTALADTENVCCMCEGPCQSHRCLKCKRLCHPFCGRAISEGYGADVIFQLCDVQKTRVSIQQTASENQDRQVKQKSNCFTCVQVQAEKLLRRGAERLDPIQVGDQVRIPVPMFDRSRSTARNLLGIVLEEPKTGKTSIANFKTATQFQVHSSWHSQWHNQRLTSSRSD